MKREPSGYPLLWSPTLLTYLHIYTYIYVTYWPSTEPSIKRCTCVNKQKQVCVRQLYNQVPQTAWVSQFQLELESVGDRMLAEWEPAPDRGLGPSVTHSWAAQPECKRSAAMVRRTWGQYVAVCPRLQLTSHTQPTSTLSRIKCERYIFIKKCVRSFIEVCHYVWLCFRIYLYMYYVLIIHIRIYVETYTYMYINFRLSYLL